MSSGLIINLFFYFNLDKDVRKWLYLHQNGDERKGEENGHPGSEHEE